MRLRLVNGRVLDPVTGAVQARSLCLEGGLLVADDGGPAEERDLEGHIVAPGFVDLHGALVHPERDGRAAVAGGFTTVLASVDHPGALDRVDAVAALQARSARAPCRVEAVGALTVDLAGEALAEVGLLCRAGCVAVGQGARVLASSRVLRHALEYAERVGARVFLRGADPDLERGGVVAEGSRAVRLGLPAVPAAAEEIGIHRLAALARLTGARVHVTHVWSAAGVRALRRLHDEGATLTASTTAAHLALDPDATGLSPYDGQLRFVPPLGDEQDRQALAQAVLDGVIVAVASDHRPWPAHAKEGTLEEARPGAVTLDATFPLVLGALGGDVVAAVRALTVGPARVLGREPARLQPGEPADLVSLDPDASVLLDRPRGAHGNTPLAGSSLTGRVVSTWVGGRHVHGTVGRTDDIG